MNRTTQQLTQEVTKFYLEQNTTIDPFLAELVVKFAIISCYQDISRNVQISENDYKKLRELAISILHVDQPQNCITALTLRLLGASIAEYVNYFDLKNSLESRPRELAAQCYQQVQPLHNPDTVYAHLEQLLTDSCRPFALEQNNTQLAYGLKISLNSILPRSDVIVFRDMLVKESQQDKPGQVSSGEKQLIELAEVTAGVSLVGDPPIQALQALEQQIVILLKQIEIQMNQQLGLYTSTLLPMTLFQLDCNAQTKQQQQAARQLLLYQINRSSVIQCFTTLFKQIQALSRDFETVNKNFKDNISQLQVLLKSQESIPKATIYPKFAAIARLYQTLQSISEQLVQLKTWHSRVSPHLEDRDFTPLPDANAKNPLYDSSEVVKAREWFIKVHSGQIQGQKQDKESIMRSRFTRLALVLQTQNAQASTFLKDLSQFTALDSDQIFDCDCLFNGIDPVLAFTPTNSSLGVISFANAPHTVYQLSNLSQKITVNNPALELIDNRAARERAQASLVTQHMTTFPSPRGYELVSFSTVQSKAVFEQNPALFLSYPLALSLSSIDYLPLIMLMDLPKLARILNSVQLKPLRQHLLNTSPTLFFEFSPLQKQAPTTDEPPVQNLHALLYKNIGAKKILADSIGYIQKPKCVELFERFLLGRLSEAEQQNSIFSSQFSVETILSSEVLSFYGDFYGHAVLQKYVEYKKNNYEVNSETLIGQESVVQKQLMRGVGVDQNVNTVEEEIQTPLHFYESHLVEGYTSSEWELRARALRLHQIQQKSTKIMNTDTTGSKSNGCTQTVEKKDAEVQNKVDGGNHAVQHYSYQRKVYPEEMYESQAKIVRERCQINMKIDLDQIKKDADKFRQLRTGGK
ncbi:Conserved_hypothetical protein [Hexamita inflata]|uniref:Cilia- and flagella-associated protein 206 n=1 Tax=Hexamita inflata TaxID=28002 RepID=A0AA86PEZ9_9EUKA|nr:Conserved hypothetical protein [Hexamita inflata]